MHHRVRLGQALLAGGNDDGRAILDSVAADAPALGLARLAEEAARPCPLRPPPFVGEVTRSIEKEGKP
jgi:hypothetical protein